MLAHARGIPSTVDTLLFMLGAVVGFTVVGAVSLGGARARVRVDPLQPALWAGFHVFAIGIAIGAATTIAHLLANRAAWPLGGFAATIIYLLVLAAQLALSG